MFRVLGSGLRERRRDLFDNPAGHGAHGAREGLCQQGRRARRRARRRAAALSNVRAFSALAFSHLLRKDLSTLSNRLFAWKRMDQGEVEI